MPAWLRPITVRLSPAIRNLVVVYAVLFGIYVMAEPLRHLIYDDLALGPRVLVGAYWQPLTSLFVYIDFLNFLFAMIGLWFAGATVERIFGQRRFLVLFFATGLVANLVITAGMVVFGMPIRNPGCGNSVLALFVAMGVAYGRAPLQVWGQLVLQARVLAWIFVGVALLSELSQGAWPVLAGTLVSQGLAYLLAGGKVGPLLARLSGGLRRTSLGVMNGGRAKGRKDYLN
jgi:membrane associated rhomboid family serine protease